MIPLFHDLADGVVLIFGGGPVGARKARRFGPAGTVIVVSPHFADEDFYDAQRIRAAPARGDIPGWFDRFGPDVVVAATDKPTINEAVELEARERGVLSNRADRHTGHAPGDVIVPATYRDDPVVVAIGTGGTSPALSGHLRERIEAELAGAGHVARASAQIRSSLREVPIDAGTRHELLRELVRDDRVWAAARSDPTGVEGVAADVLEELREDIDH